MLGISGSGRKRFTRIRVEHGSVDERTKNMFARRVRGENKHDGLDGDRGFVGSGKHGIAKEPEESSKRRQCGTTNTEND
jgi:hypothetical protein